MITPSREIILPEDVAYRRSVSETILTKVGATTNLISERQYDTHGFHFNSLYRRGVTTIGRDGIFPIIFDMEIVAITLFNRVNGSSGTTEIDLRWLNNSGNIVGSIFSTTPKFTSAVGNNAYMIRRFTDNTTLKIPASGATLPVLSKQTFNQGDAILAQITSAMLGAEDCSILVHFRPR